MVPQDTAGRSEGERNLILRCCSSFPNLLFSRRTIAMPWTTFPFWTSMRPNTTWENTGAFWFTSCPKKLQTSLLSCVQVLFDHTLKVCSAFTLWIIFPDYRPGDAPLVSEDMLQGAEHKRQAAQPEDFLHLFVKNSVHMVEFLEHMIQVRSSDSSQTVYNTILEHYLSQWSNTKVGNISMLCRFIMN